MMYWYEFVLIYFVSGLLLIALNKLYRILPPQTRMGCVVLIIALIALVVAWWFILEPYETFEYLPPTQKDQILYATLVNLPLGHLAFSYLLGREVY